MAAETELRERIVATLATFSRQPIREAATKFLGLLGYRSDRTLNPGSSSPRVFLELLNAQTDSTRFNESKALFSDWTSADLLFQLTDEELSGHASLFKDTVVEVGLLRSYLFFAIELTGGDYPRGKLTGIARQINRVFPMPVMVLIKHLTDKKPVISIAVINRRQSKRDAARDVLGKVTIIRDVSLTQPHRGHLDILASFAVPNLVHPQRLPITTFDTLHAAWEEIFNVELLNRRFYRELANWYFWALPQVEFPADTEKDDDKRRATSLIRLLTRLMFCWFLKEKGLIPERLFVEPELKRILNDVAPDASTYHQAILQNLFFATLNQRMGKDRNGNPYRAFARDEGFPKNRATYGVDTLYRYEEHFRDPDTVLDLFADVPFLNGGLFECLDRIEDGTNKKLYLDGFSRNKKKRPKVPNSLFFAEEQTVDLSNAYGEPKRRNEKVRGLLRILHSYKFTVVENTPIDQEIALDPELLGKVFENLLASYNEETKTTARKQTGSFYTPRPIVEYMVDASLEAYLASALIKTGMSEVDAQAGLDILFAYTERHHPFDEGVVATLLDAIHTCKILDPACGSGAFPMGMLHKLVYIIHKLDPDNERWKQLQIAAAAKILDSSAREAAIAAIESDFADNENDYGRKLYLIENCLYGIDIQPIAIQISKLRFFISLVCDQRTNRSKKENHGIRPLPNLETKFVAANTLIGLPEMEQLALVPQCVYKIEAEIESLYHKHFSVQRRDLKLALQKKIKELRKELGRLLAESLMGSKKAQHVADWDPFDPQASSDFFDPMWMFGRSMGGGCDIVIGNPPYMKERDSKHLFDLVAHSTLGKKYQEGKMDYWFYFLHRAFEIAKDGGVVAFITSRYWMNSAGSKKLVKHIQERASLFHVVDIGSLTVFEQVAGHHMLHFYKVGQSQSNCLVKRLDDSLDDIVHSTDTEHLHVSIQPAHLLFIGSKQVRLYQQAISIPSNLTLGDRYEVSQGVVQNPDKVSAVMSRRYGLRRGAGVFVLERHELSKVNLNSTELSFVKPFYDESAISPFRLKRWEAKSLLYITRGNCLSLSGMPNIKRHLLPYKQIMDARRETVKGSIEWFQLHWPRDPRFFESEKVVLPSMFRTPTAAYISEPAYFGLGSNIIIGARGPFSLKVLCALLNSSVGKWWFFNNSKHRGVGVDVGVDRLRQFPLPSHTESFGVVDTLVDLFNASLLKEAQAEGDLAGRFLVDLIDACVFELYFREHMAERNLLFLADLSQHLGAYDPVDTDVRRRELLASLHRTLNAPSSEIRNRLLRLSADSPDLLSVVKEGGTI
ncbi:MAG: Eco57I restriction-modification methylase domain-containing protein [Steroidobacteraceae bacterium]